MRFEKELRNKLVAQPDLIEEGFEVFSEEFLNADIFGKDKEGKLTIIELKVNTQSYNIKKANKQLERYENDFNDLFKFLGAEAKIGRLMFIAPKGDGLLKLSKQEVEDEVQALAARSRRFSPTEEKLIHSLINRERTWIKRVQENVQEHK